VHWYEVTTIIVSLIGTLGGLLWYLLAPLKEAIERIDTDIKSLHDDMTATNRRIDTLYQMFVDLLREGRK
jgi:hypothetical protein